MARDTGSPSSTISPHKYRKNKHFSSLSCSLVKPRGQDLTEEILPGPVCPSAQSPEAPSCPGEVTQWPERHGQGKTQGRQPPRTGTRQQTTAPALTDTAALRWLQGQSLGAWAHTARGFPPVTRCPQEGPETHLGRSPQLNAPWYARSDPGRPLQGHRLCTSP